MQTWLEKLQEALDHAARLAGEERSRYLDSTCGNNLEMRRELQSLLSAFDQSGGFLTQPALRGAAAECGEAPGEIIDEYRLLGVIGEGGFGSVFLAEQQSPLRRTIALKILKPGMDSQQVIARFEAERQALA